jgi:hypothetical protein
VDPVICLGDVATLGLRPNAVIDILGELSCRCIMGNHDEVLLDAELIHTAEQVAGSMNWTRCSLLLSNLIVDCLSFVRQVQQFEQVLVMPVMDLRGEFFVRSWGRFSFRRLRSGSRSARRGQGTEKLAQFCGLAQLVFRSAPCSSQGQALTPEHAPRK